MSLSFWLFGFRRLTNFWLDRYTPWGLPECLCTTVSLYIFKNLKTVFEKFYTILTYELFYNSKYTLKMHINTFVIVTFFFVPELSAFFTILCNNNSMTKPKTHTYAVSSTMSNFVAPLGAAIIFPVYLEHL